MKAMDIEDFLVWGFRDQRVGEALGGGVPLRGAFDREPMGVSRDGVITMERIGALGCAVQGGGPRGAGDVARDAEVLWEVVESLVAGARPGLRALIRTHAAAGTVPDWQACRPRCFAMFGTHTDSKGRWAAREYVIDPEKSGLGWQPWYALVDYEGTPEHPDATLAGRRTVYLAWWEGLHVIAAYFQTHPTLLVDHVVTGFRRSPRPWGEDF